MSVSPTCKQVAAEIIDELRRVADPAAERQARTYFKEPVTLMGVRAAELHRVARDTHGRVKKAWQPADVVRLCDQLLADDRLEVKSVGLLLCGRFHRLLDGDAFRSARSWIERGDCDCWAAIDTLCIYVLGLLLLRRPELVSELKGWTDSPSLWLRRAAAAALVKPARAGHLLDETYATAQALADDREDLIHKVTGWLLREAGRTDLRRLAKFLRDHGPAFHRTTVRYAIERFPAAERQRLLKQTRAGG